jgi:hypothetical protein
MNGFTSGTQALQGRKVNHDPVPWRVELPGIHAERSAQEVAGHSVFDPRPECDVLDNPILARFRTWVAGESPVEFAAEFLAASEYWWLIEGARPWYARHARRVLSKLAALA